MSWLHQLIISSLNPFQEVEAYLSETVAYFNQLVEHMEGLKSNSGVHSSSSSSAYSSSSTSSTKTAATAITTCKVVGVQTLISATEASTGSLVLWYTYFHALGGGGVSSIEMHSR